MKKQGENPPSAQHPARPSTNPPFTVANAMLICGIDSTNIFQGDSHAKWIAREVFDDDFMSCMEKEFK